MRIHDAYRQALTHATDVKKPTPRAAEGPAAAPREGGDVKVSLSGRAKDLAGAAAAEAQKVERLREAVQNGSLKIDARAIAEKIVGEGE